MDFNDVLIKGDSTLMGMKIEKAYFDSGDFSIETTGAKFEYVKGQLKLYQGLDVNNRRSNNSPKFITQCNLWSKTSPP